MDDVNERAVMGGNHPPPDLPYDPEVLRQCQEKAAEFLKTGEEWVALGEITSEEVAQRLTDYVAGAKSVLKVIEENRVKFKKPWDLKADAVQKAFATEKTSPASIVDRAVKMVAPLQAAWIKKKNDRAAEEKRQREEAAAEARRVAEEARKAAEETGSIMASLAAEEAEKAADEAEKTAKRTVKTNVASASGGGRAMSLRTYRYARVANVRIAFMRYASHPDVIEVLERLATADLRADATLQAIDGFTIETKETVA